MKRILLLVPCQSPTIQRLLYGLIEFGGRHQWDVRACELEAGRDAAAREFAPHGVLSAGKPSFRIPGNAKVVSFQAQEKEALPFVSFDEEACGRLAAEHLLACGYRHFAYAGASLHGAAAQRHAAFCKTLKAAGYRVIPTPTQGTLSPWLTPVPLLGSAQLANWLVALPKPVGIFSPSDTGALGLLTASQRCGFSVPGEVGILGAGDDSALCELVEPGISSVHMPYRRLGFALGEALEACFRDVRRKPRRWISPTGVSRRGSTRITAAHDPSLSKVFDFIRENLQESLRVESLAGMAGLKRRDFEVKFRQECGRTPLQEILHLRLEKSADLMQRTSLTLAEIAKACGFSSAFHLSNTFSRAYSMSPAAFRRSGTHPIPISSKS